MKSAYRGLTHLIALLIVVQVAAIAFAAFGLVKFIKDGGIVTKANIDHVHYTGSAGWPIHSVVGEMLIPLVVLVLLVVAFLAKLPGGVKWAGIVVGLVVLQVLLGVASASAPALGVLHGILALALLAAVLFAGYRVKDLDPVTTA